MGGGIVTKILRHRLFWLGFLLAVGVWCAPTAVAQKGAQGEQHLIDRLELRDTKVNDAARLIAELSGLNVAPTQEAGQKTVTLYLQNVTALRAIETVAKSAGLTYRLDPDTQTYRIMTPTEYQKDIVVAREHVTRVFTLLHPNALSVASAIENLFGERVILSLQPINDDQLLPPFNSVGLGVSDVVGYGYGVGLSGYGAGRSRTRFGLGGYGGIFGQSFAAGSSPFARSGMVSGAGLFARAGSGTSGLVGVGGLQEETLTAGQITELERRLKTLEGEPRRTIPSALLREVAQGEPPIYVAVNQQHNLVLVRTSDTAALKDIEQLVYQLDRPTPQVLLEMKILEVTLSDDFRSIFDYQLMSNPQTTGPYSPRLDINPLPFTTTTGGTVAQDILGMGNFQREGGTLIYQALSHNIRVRMQLLAAENRVNVVGTPLVLAANNRPAQVFVGEEAVLTTGINTSVVTPSLGSQSITALQPVTQVRNVGNTLMILPKINADRSVTLFISQDSSRVRENGSRIPVPTRDGGVTELPIDTVTTANLQSSVVAKDGMTIAVGGLIQDRVRSVVEKVPVLGDLRYVGFFFRRQQQERIKTELVLLITPYILVMPGEAESVSWARMQAISTHPYHQYGDAALGSYFHNDLTPAYCRPPLLCPGKEPHPWFRPAEVAPERRPPLLNPPLPPPLEPYGDAPPPWLQPPPAIQSQQDR